MIELELTNATFIMYPELDYKGIKDLCDSENMIPAIIQITKNSEEELSYSIPELLDNEDGINSKYISTVECMRGFKSIDVDNITQVTGLKFVELDEQLISYNDTNFVDAENTLHVVGAIKSNNKHI